MKGKALTLPLPTRTEELPEAWVKLEWNSRDGRVLPEILVPAIQLLFAVATVAGCIFSLALGEPAGLLLVLIGPGLLLALTVFLRWMGCELSREGIRIRTIPVVTIPWATAELSFRKNIGSLEILCVQDLARSGSRTVVVPQATREQGARDVRARRLDQAAEQLAALAADAQRSAGGG